MQLVYDLFRYMHAESVTLLLKVVQPSLGIHDPTRAYHVKRPSGIAQSYTSSAAYRLTVLLCQCC